MNYLYIIQSNQTDEYKLRITSEDNGMLSDEVRQTLASENIEVFDIELERTKKIRLLW